MEEAGAGLDVAGFESLDAAEDEPALSAVPLEEAAAAESLSLVLDSDDFDSVESALFELVLFL